MTRPAFVAMADDKMASLIEQATERVVVAAPAIRKRSAEAISSTASRLARGSVQVVLDCDESVFRLGYGDFDAMESLRSSGVGIRQASGLRIGVLVVDDRAWIYSPTALYVQEEVHSDETPNAIEVSPAEIEHLLPRVADGQLNNTPSPDAPDVTEAEIGVGTVSDEVVEKIAESLSDAPPIAFDVARQVRVFEPYIQYVKTSLTGCAIQRRTIEVPKSIQGLDPNADLSSRLHTKFDLIERSSTLSSKFLESELNTIRDDFTRSLGQPWGRVLLKNIRRKFDERIEQFREKLDVHKKKMQQELGDVLAESRKKLIAHFLPLVKTSRPDVFMGQLTTDNPTDEQFEKILEVELNKKIPKVDELLTYMKLEVQFSDVTYETLNEDGFGEKLRDAYPHVDWDKPFDEFDAAKARDEDSKKKPEAEG